MTKRHILAAGAALALGAGSAFAVTAGDLGGSAVVLGNNAKGTCFGFALEVPKGAEDAVLTMSHCLVKNDAASLHLVAKEGKTLAARSVVALGQKDESQLVLVRFASGSVDKAEDPAKALARKDAKPELFGGSPVLDKTGAVQGLVGLCASGEKTAGCSVAKLDKASLKKLFAEVQERVWGDDEAPAAGNEHAYRWHRRGGRGYVAYGGYYGGFSYAPSVSYSYTVVNVVYRPVYITVYNNSFNGNSNSFNSYRNVGNDSRGSYRVNQGINSTITSDDSDYSARSTPAAPVEVLPAYVGVYDANAVAQGPTVVGRDTVAANAQSANRPSEAIAQASAAVDPDRSVAVALALPLNDTETRDLVARGSAPEQKQQMERVARALAKRNGEAVALAK